MEKNNFSGMSDKDLRELVRTASNEMAVRGLPSIYELHKYDIDNSVLWDIDERVSRELYEYNKLNYSFYQENFERKGIYAEKLESGLFDICDLTLGNYQIKGGNMFKRWVNGQEGAKVYRNQQAIVPDPCFVPQDYENMHKEICDIIRKYLKRRDNKKED